jgi:hypothetical protein
MKTAEDWIKDGTATTVPETTSTPPAEPPAETTTSGPARDAETGKFVAAAPADDASTTSAARATPPAEEATPAVVAAVTAAAADAGQTVEEFLEARRGDQPFQFPKDVQLPWKRGSETGFAPVTEVLKSFMLEKDYRHKTQTLADERRQSAIEKARITAEKQAIEQEREQLRAAMIDPEKLEQYQAHYEQMRTNPVYRKMVEDALDKRVTEAELNVRLDEEREQVNREAAENLYSTIVETAKQYPGVDPERVRQIYAKGLVSGDIKEITEESIHQVYKQEADYTSRIVSPLQAELTELRTQIAALSSAKVVEAHNANTDKKLAQAKATPVVAAVGNGTAVGTSSPPTQFKPFTNNDYSDKIREWSKRA